MKLLGDWNWYFPGWLEWLPEVPSRRHDDPSGDGARGAPGLEIKVEEGIPVAREASGELDW